MAKGRGAKAFKAGSLQALVVGGFAAIAVVQAVRYLLDGDGDHLTGFYVALALAVVFGVVVVVARRLGGPGGEPVLVTDRYVSGPGFTVATGDIVETAVVSRRGMVGGRPVTTEHLEIRTRAGEVYSVPALMYDVDGLRTEIAQVLFALRKR